MISRKFFTLGLLCVAQLASAIVQLDTSIEINNSSKASKTKFSVVKKIALNANQLITIHQHDDIRIESEILEQQETGVITQFSVYLKNAAGTETLISQPVISAEYGKQAILTLGQKKAEEEGLLTIKVQATKIS